MNLILVGLAVLNSRIVDLLRLCGVKFNLEELLANPIFAGDYVKLRLYSVYNILTGILTMVLCVLIAKLVRKDTIKWFNTA